MEHATEWTSLREALGSLSQDEKLQLIELVVQSMRAPSSSGASADRRMNLDRLRRELGTLPVANPADGFSNRDHDDALYGVRP